MNSLLLILLLFILITNSLNILYYYQNDNYHFRIFKIFYIKDIKYKWYKYLYIIFLFYKSNIILFFIIVINILLSLLTIKRHKIKYTKRITRLFIIYVLVIFTVVLSKHSLPLILIINSIYLTFNLLIYLISSWLEKLINKTYYKKAKNKITKYQPFIIGITGSCGKTSVKNYIYEMLKNDLMVYKSPKSYNTLNGLSLTINKQLKAYNQTFILEMGLSHKNDIKNITKYFSPNISIITEILNSHLETMKNIDNIVKEKMQIIKRMQPNGLIIINNDNQLIKDNINKYNIHNNKIIKIGLNNDNDYIAKNIKIKPNGLEFDIIDKIKNTTICVKNNVIGRHNIYNILITYAILSHFKIDHFNLNFLSNYENRLEIKTHHKMIILNDSYNSNINGFMSALEILSLYEKPKYIITPGIVETGKQREETIKKICEKIIEICDFCYVIDNKNTQIFTKFFDENDYKNYEIKKDFISAFNELKNKEIILLIENDLTDYYLLK